MKILCLLALLASSVFAQTTVSEPALYLQPGTLWSGQLVITWPSFTTADGRFVVTGTKIVTVRNGALSVALWPTLSATPSVAYTAVYRGAGFFELWNVPATPSTVALQDVRRYSSLSGNTLLNGAAVPSNAIGANGDWYIRTINPYCMYGPKAANAWPGTCFSLAGPTGPTGLTGATGPQGASFAGYHLTDLESMSGAVLLHPRDQGGDRFIGILAADVTLDIDPSLAQPNEVIYLDFLQTGGRKITFSGRFSGQACADPAPGAHYTQMFIWDATLARATAPGTSDGTPGAIITPGCHTVLVPEVDSTLEALSANDIVTGDRTLQGKFDAGGATHTLPFKVGLASAIPATCTTGEIYYASDGVSGRNILKCQAGVWTSIVYTADTAAHILATACLTGQFAFATDATAGKNLYFCSANAWVQMLGSLAPLSSNTMRGTGDGGLAAVTGTASDFVHVDGTSGASPGQLLAVNLQGATVASGATTFAGASLSTASTEGVRQWAMTRDGNLKRLVVKMSGVQPAGCTLTVIARNSSTGSEILQITINNSDGTTVKTNITDATPYVLGNLVTFKLVNGSCTSGGINTISGEAQGQ